MSSSSKITRPRTSRPRRLGILAALALIGAFLAAFVVPAMAPANSASAPPAASAKVGNTRVQNVSGASVAIWCDYNGSTRYSLSAGQHSQQAGKCDKRFNYDTDQIRVSELRCMKVVGPKVKDGWYRLKAFDRVKIYDLTAVGVHAYSSSKCGGKPYYNVH